MLKDTPELRKLLFDLDSLSASEEVTGVPSMSVHMVLVELGFIDPLAILTAVERVVRLLTKKSKPPRMNLNS
ncbi:MAG TPA: hypothetical protein PLR98_04885, partial [Chitinophagaceae bacterium]|nr:hypothetical protein [Chitinophagaceae bacterium]